MTSIFSVRQMRRELAGAGAKPVHIDQILRTWLLARPFENKTGGFSEFCEKYSLPYPTRKILPRLIASLQGLAAPLSAHFGADGSTRQLLRLSDGQRIESVWLPKNGVCVSTQVGCAVGCAFCMTGKGGLLRQMESSEILAQAVLARRAFPVCRVVLMGMGEPAHNLDNVLEAVRLLGQLGGIGHKNLVISSVGDPRLFERLYQEPVRPALALSLHSTHPETRARLIPKAPAITPEELVEAGEAYARFSGYPIQYQWTLLEDINDGEDEIKGIIRLLSGKYAMMNLIPHNALVLPDPDTMPRYKRPGMERIIQMTRQLNRHGILTRIRHSAAQDVEGGCGQLWARNPENIAPQNLPPEFI